jgi:hypothetical protein
MTLSRKTLYPQAPVGWDARAAGPSGQPRRTPIDPLTDWARARGYGLEPQADVVWYQRWAPFVYVGVPQRAGRAVLAQFGDTRLWVAELALIDTAFPVPPVQPIPFSTIAFVISPSLVHRAALRSRAQSSVEGEEPFSVLARLTPGGQSRLRSPDKDRFNRRTYGSRGRLGLGDASFDAEFDVTSPSIEEARMTITPALRSYVTRTHFRGLVELRPKGMIVARAGAQPWEPNALDALIATTGAIFAAAARGSGY